LLSTFPGDWPFFTALTLLIVKWKIHLMCRRVSKLRKDCSWDIPRLSFSSYTDNPETVPNSACMTFALLIYCTRCCTMHILTYFLLVWLKPLYIS